ncbi:conserved hypothetical protein [Longilinea arvoryzae]|uniref:Integral membrane protein n=1 Tax=Longilinea arvoryzae TaxID=360412 RepID=A0A0K8MXF8_9CHLR|nr:lysylphosphatidylglycerol synthase transmembrane domain-containing protein [Longilinea arvoryzae]GAP15948.1 conserved hypothetical protein [Longilinea arvoryzae]
MIRKILFSLLLVISGFFVLTHFTEMQAVAGLLGRGDWRFLLMGVLIEGLWLLNVNQSYKALYRAVGIEESRKKLFLMATAAFFITTMAPAAGMTGLAVFIEQTGKEKGKPAPHGRVTVACILYLLADYFGLLAVIPLALYILWRRNQITASAIIASIILVVLAVGLATLLMLGARSSHKLSVVLGFIARFVNKISGLTLHRQAIHPDWAQNFSVDVNVGVSSLREQPQMLIQPMLLGLNNKALMMFVLLSVFLAFNISFTIPLLIAAYALGYLFSVVSPTPSGIGIVEGVMTVALRSLGMPLENAATVTLAYRGFTFWLPLVVGGWSFRRLQKAEKQA